MATVFLVAGSSTDNLRTFLEQRGTLEIEESYTTLYKEIDNIEKSISYPDKFVYISTKDDPNFTKDIQALRNLLIGDAIFSPREIVFFVMSGDNEKQANFCEGIMRVVEREAQKNPGSVTVPEYSIHRFDEDPPFDKIYSILMGTNEPDNVEVSLDTVYLVERNNKSKYAFDQEDNTRSKIEPFSYKNIESYSNLRLTLKKQDSGELLYDEETEPLRRADIDLPEVKLSKVELPFLTIVSGNRGSGVTTLVSALTASVTNLNKRVVVVECNSRQNLVDIFSSCGVPYNRVDVKEFLKSPMPELSEGITLVKVKNYDSLSFLSNFLFRVDTEYVDCIFVDVHIEDLTPVLTCSKIFTPTIIMTSLPSRSDILYLKKYVKIIPNFILILNKFYRDTKLRATDIPPSEIRGALPNVSRIFEPMFFSHLSIDNTLAEFVLGVRQ